MAQVTDNKEIIIFLITQEIKHTKFLQSLSNIGLEPECNPPSKKHKPLKPKKALDNQALFFLW